MVPGAAQLPADPTLVNPRMLASAETAVIATLLLLLYGYRRRSYILWWMWGWWLMAGASALIAHPFHNVRIDAMAYGTAQFGRIVTSLFFVIAADAYRQAPTLRNSYALVLLPVALWFVLAPAALGLEAVFSPGFVLAAGGYFAAGGAHLWVGRRNKGVGASLVGIMLVVFAVLNIWLSAQRGMPEGLSTPRLLLPTLVVYLLAALGMQLMAFEDMTYELRHTNRSLEAAQAELRQMVISDPLTGCRNRRFFEEIIGRELQRHRRYRTPMSIVFIDIDRFKAINDTLGHETGDRVLRDVAGFLLRNFREADYLFRWGGDEFLLLISCGEGEARARAREIQQAFSESGHVTGLPAGVALSVGSVEIPVETDDILPLIQRADERMYANKRRRRA